MATQVFRIMKKSHFGTNQELGCVQLQATVSSLPYTTYATDGGHLYTVQPGQYQCFMHIVLGPLVFRVGVD